MATKQVESTELVEAFSEFKELKNIDRASMMSILEDVFRNMLKKKYGTADNFDIVINTDKGDLDAFRTRVIVEGRSRVGSGHADQLLPKRARYRMTLTWVKMCRMK